MGWSGRAPAPPASEADKGRQRQGARHVSDTQYRDRRDWHRYRQELVPRRRPRWRRAHRGPELIETSLSEYLEATNGCLVHVVGKELVGFDILGRVHLARETV